MSGFRFTPLTLGIIRRHAELRRDATTIAGMMNCSSDTIENICKHHGIELVKITDGAPPLSPCRTKDGIRPQFRAVDIAIANDAFERIQHEAARRGVRATTLIARVAEIVATDSLFSAVLDK
jgi:hypothetical protein